MADRPILFSAAMIRALLAGRKTQTRRVLDVPPVTFDAVFHDDGIWYIGDAATGRREAKLPVRYQVGDRLWVREAVRAIENDVTFERHVEYIADEGRSAAICSAEDNNSDSFGRWWDLLAYRSDDPDLTGGKTVPPIHMPRWASRLTLTATDVRVQRLKEISEEDAIEEGFHLEPSEIEANAKLMRRELLPHILAIGGGKKYPLTVRSKFFSYWIGLHGLETWDGVGAYDQNPWVVAVTFAVEHRNIDASEA